MWTSFPKRHFVLFLYKGLCYAIFRSLRGLNVSWCKLNFRNNGPVLLFTVLFTKMRTLKLKSRLHTCNWIFCCHQLQLQSQAMSLWTTETQKADRNQPITNQWPFEPLKFCLLRHRLRWLRATKNGNVSWLLNFRIPMFLKSAAILYWGIETVSCHLLLWMTRMDMDWKLKNVSQLFNF